MTKQHKQRFFDLPYPNSGNHLFAYEADEDSPKDWQTLARLQALTLQEAIKVDVYVPIPDQPGYWTVKTPQPVPPGRLMDL